MDTKHIKQHIRRAHPAIHGSLSQVVLQRCKPFKSQLVTNSDCPWCSCKVWSPGRHVDQCPVLFQLCLAAAYCEQQQPSGSAPTAPGAQAQAPVTPFHDGGRIESGGGDLQVLPAPGGGSPRRTDQGRPAEQAPTAGHSEQARPKATIRAFFAVRPRRTDGCDPDNGPDAHAPGGDHRRAPHGQDADALLPGGGRCQRAARPLPGSEGMGKTAGGGNESDYVAHTHPAASVPHSAAQRSRSLHDGGPRGDHAASSRGLDEHGSELDKTTMVSPGQEIGPAPGGGRDEQPGPHCKARLLAEEPEGRGDPQVSFDQEAASPGGRTGHNGCLLSLGEPPRDGGDSSARDLCAADRCLGPAARGIIYEKSHPAQTADGSAGGAHCLRTIGNAGAAGGTLPSSLGLPPFTLINDGNTCYINSLLYVAWLAALHTETLSTLPLLLRSLRGEGKRARRVLGYYMMGWPRAWEQNDVAEFYDFLIPRLFPAAGAVWQGRVMTQDGTHVTQTTALNKCIPLPLPPSPKLDIQELVNAWHQQDDLCAVFGTPSWLCLQLPRFDACEGIKTHQPYIVPGMLNMPTFVDAASQAITWHSYRVCAIIRHHGATFCAGHYTVMVRGSSDFILDDASPPKQATSQDLDDASRSMYLLILCATRNPVTPSRDLSSASSSFVGHGVHRSDSVHGTGKVAVEAALSSGDLDQTIGEGS